MSIYTGLAVFISVYTGTDRIHINIYGYRPYLSQYIWACAVFIFIYGETTNNLKKKIGKYGNFQHGSIYMKISLYLIKKLISKFQKNFC